MKLDRMNTVMSLVAAAGLSCAASAQEQSPSTQPSQPSENATQQQPAPALPQSLKQLVGEWEGQVQVRKAGGETSSSLISASNRLEDGGLSMVSCFQGFAFGKPMDGAAMWKLSPETGRVEHAMFNTVTQGALRVGAKPSEQSSGLTLAGTCTSTQTTTPAKLDQVVTIQGEQQYTVEWFTTGENGKKTLVMKLEMTRLPQGQQSEAVALFGNTDLLSKVKGPIAQTASAER